VIRVVPLVAVVCVLAACGGSSSESSTPPALGSKPTTASGSAEFSLVVSGKVAGASVQAHETGAVSFTQRRAHLYKLNPGGGLPQELVLVGPLTYTNANIGAAMQDTSVRPWTKLDTRKLTRAQVLERPDELAHVRVVAYLADGVVAPKTVGTETVEDTKTTHLRGMVDPKRVVSSVAASERDSVRRAIRNDYVEKRFPADFWIDGDGRLRRVRVAYTTSRGTKITLDGGFSNFGVKLDLRLPPKSEIKDITP
jgi:LppX_LprAFG lipoprotein